MEKKLINADLEIILQGIIKCGDQKKQPFRSKLRQSARIIKDELKNLYDDVEKPKGWDDYIEKETALIEKYAVGRDAKGNPIFGDNQETVDAELKLLQDADRFLINKNKTLQKEFRATVMKQPIGEDIKLRFVEETELPKELTLEQEMGIDLLIKPLNEHVKKPKKPTKTN